MIDSDNENILLSGNQATSSQGFFTFQKLLITSNPGTSICTIFFYFFLLV